MPTDRPLRTTWSPTSEAPAHLSLHNLVLASIEHSVNAAGMSLDQVRCAIEDEWPGLTIRITLPAPVNATAERALGVRALDAVRSAGGTFGDVDVIVCATPPMWLEHDGS